MTEDNTVRIAALNDAFRQSFSGGTVLLTSGIRAFPPAEIDAIANKVSSFADFTEANDPYGEHDFGSFPHQGTLINWKIDYYDKVMEMGSPDPADPKVTTRVLTIFLAEEY
jgi:hypothetical protein